MEINGYGISTAVSLPLKMERAYYIEKMLIREH